MSNKTDKMNRRVRCGHLLPGESVTPETGEKAASPEPGPEGCSCPVGRPGPRGLGWSRRVPALLVPGDLYKLGMRGPVGEAVIWEQGPPPVPLGLGP